MVLEIDRADTWEVVAAIQVAQAANLLIEAVPSYASDLVACAGLCASSAQEALQRFQFGEAYRSTDGAKRIYHEALASTTGVTISGVGSPNFPGIKASDGNRIVLAPYGLKESLNLPLGMWRMLAKMLRTYDCELILMCEPHQRMDSAAFFENEMITTLPVRDKLEILASATLVVGVPNAWTWCATAWTKKIALYYPEDEYGPKWFPMTDPNFGRLLFDVRNINAAAALAGLRQLIGILRSN